MASNPSVAELRSRMSYDPLTGALSWLRQDASDRSTKIWNSRFAGKAALTSKDTHGYYRGGFGGRQFLAHRVCWALHYGEWPSGNLDHINGDRSDNRIANLRQVSVGENCKNVSRKSSNKSGLSGVWWCQRVGKWHAYVTLTGKRKHLGSFAEKFDAILVRLMAQREMGFSARHGTSAQRKGA